MNKVDFADKWQISGEHVKEDELEESFVNRELKEIKSENFNPIVLLPELNKGEAKNSWRPPKRKLKTVIRHRAPVIKDN